MHNWTRGNISGLKVSFVNSAAAWWARDAEIAGCAIEAGEPRPMILPRLSAKRTGGEGEDHQKSAKQSELGDVAQGMGGGVRFGLLDHEEFIICSCCVRVDADCSHLSIGWLTGARKRWRGRQSRFRSRTGKLSDICFPARGPDRAHASGLLGKALYGEGAEFCVFLANFSVLLVLG